MEPARPRDDMIGKVLLGRFRLERRLGQGTSGVVYMATQLRIERPVAVKVLMNERARDATSRSRFLREAQMVAALAHPNIVRVLEFDEIPEEELVFIAMELVDGESFADLIAGGPLEWQHAVTLAARIASGLADAHGHAIVHRDLKPENLMLSKSVEDVQPKILDFGMALPQEVAARLTAEGAICGTPLYMAPEQARSAEVGPWTDVYSLGVILFELLTGAPPFDDTTSPFGLLLRKVKEPAPSVATRLPPGSTVPTELVTLVDLMLHLEPSDRPPDGHAAFRALQALLPAGELRLRTDRGHPTDRYHAWRAHTAAGRANSTLLEDDDIRPTSVYEPVSGPSSTREGSVSTNYALLSLTAVITVVLGAMLVWTVMDRDERRPPALGPPAPLEPFLASPEIESVESEDVPSTSSPAPQVATDAGVDDASRDVGPLPSGCGDVAVKGGRLYEEADVSVYLPVGYDSSRRYPVLLLFHETGYTPQEAIQGRGFREAADRDQFIIAAPLSRDLPLAWRSPDVVGRVEDLLERLRGVYCVDERLIFAAGTSSGGLAVDEVACGIPLAAMAVTNWRARANPLPCNPPRPVPFISILPTEEKEQHHIRPRCLLGVFYLSMNETKERWHRNNTCDGPERRYPGAEKTDECLTWNCETPYVRCVPPRATVDRNNVFDAFAGTTAYCDQFEMTDRFGELMWTFMRDNARPIGSNEE